MKRRKIVYGEGARNDIMAIADFIARDSVINADKALARLEARIGRLETLAERGRIAPELHWHGITTVREVFEHPWRILYRLGDGEVTIVAVYDGRRQVEDVLLERFLRCDHDH